MRLADLPVLDKRTVMANWDRLVTDPRLRLADLQGYLANVSQDSYYLGEYHVFTTAGSSGLKGVFAFNRREWSTVLATVLRGSRYIGSAPRFPRRLRIATIVGGSPAHMSYGLYSSLDVGLVRFYRLAATASVSELARALEAFQPDTIQGYPSAIALMAVEQLEGRLRIHPRVVSTSSEVRTEEMAQRIRQAWGVEPFNNYGTTEGLFGTECLDRCGIVLFEDLCIVEVVDERNQPVPDGVPGHKLLITNLFNYTQPLIRYEIGDMVTLATGPCACAGPFRRIGAIEGRSDDILYLPGSAGQPVPVHPIHFRSVLAATVEVKQYQIIQDESGIHLRLVLRQGASPDEVAADVREKLEAKLRDLGVRLPRLSFEFPDAIARDPRQMGKLKLVQSRLGRKPAGGAPTSPGS